MKNFQRLEPTGFWIERTFRYHLPRLQKYKVYCCARKRLALFGHGGIRDGQG